MIFKDRTSCPWRDLPERFGPWQRSAVPFLPLG
ncbi:hypothetical protein [Actinopolyspora biskrensis]